MTDEMDLVVLNIKRPDDALFENSQDMLEVARDWKILTPKMATAAGEDLKAVKALAKQVEQQRTAITGPINKALKEVNALFKPAKEWLAEAERLLKGELLDFQTEQERIARELQAEADAKAEKERKKLERAAKLAETMRRPAKAEELREEAETQAAPIVTSAAPKIAGVVRRETWKAEVTDKPALVKHIVEARPDLMALVKIDQSALNTQARSLKDELNLPSVKVLKEASIAARG